jgi:hypothetical protein
MFPEKDVEKGAGLDASGRDAVRVASAHLVERPAQLDLDLEPRQQPLEAGHQRRLPA